MRWRVGREIQKSVRNIVMKGCLMDYSTILLNCKKSVLLSSVLGKFIVKVNTRSIYVEGNLLNFTLLQLCWISLQL